MWKRTFVIIFCLCFGWLQAADKPVKLQFLPNFPVPQVSYVEIDVAQSLPGVQIDAKSYQELDYDLAVKSDDSGIPIRQAPINLEFTLKKFKVDLEANDGKITFDSEQPGASLYLAQISRIIDRPIRINFDEKYHVSEEGTDLRALAKELPALQEFNPDTFFKELFQHLFALVGRNLVVGETFTVEVPKDPLSPLPTNLDYRITAIEDGKVYADIDGIIEPRNVKLSALMEVSDSEKQSVELVLTGTVRGKGAWSLTNALYYTLDIRYAYKGTLRIADWEWVLNANINHRVNIPNT